MRSTSGWSARGGGAKLAAARLAMLGCALLLGALAPRQAPAGSETTLPAVPAGTAQEILKSPNDTREYLAFTLPNRLQVLVVSDPDTDQAAASLDVLVGSGADPHDRPGLAHFLEHMLFLGTERFPEAGEYQSFLSEHGGSYNAFTAHEHTNYFFDVDAAYLEPVLDRFSQFFVAPSFTARYVDREKNAVDSEYRARSRDDGRRIFDAGQQAMNPRHPYTGFAVGSLDTLAERPGSSVRDELLAFHRRYYSANLMKLVVLGREPLPTLVDWVTRRFSAVPDTAAAAPATTEPLFVPGSLPRRLLVEPVKDVRRLSLSFPVPPLNEHWRTKPGVYLGNLIGHEGRGSLLSALKAKGWAEALSAGVGIDNRSEATFDISLLLTEAGLERADDVVATVFGYLGLLRERGVERRYFEEQARLAAIDFRFAEKSAPRRYVTALSGRVHDLPARGVLGGPYAMEGFEPALIREYLDRLVPSNVFVGVVAKGVEVDSVSPWFGAPYSLRPVDDASLSRWRSELPDAALAMPDPNPFIPEDLSLVPAEGATRLPNRVLERPGLTLWWHQDTDYALPRAAFFVSVRSPLASDTPANEVLTRLLVRAVNDRLTEFAYPATLAGLGYDLYKHIRGVTARISGYHDRQHLLLARIVETLTEPLIEADRFRVFKEELLRELRNSREDSPGRQASAELSDLLIDPSWTDSERVEALEPLTVEALRDFWPRLLERVDLVALAHGNLSRSRAVQLGEIVERSLLAGASPAVVPGGDVIRLPEGRRVLRELEVDHADSALVVYLQGPDRRYRTRARVALLGQLLSAPFYTSLRTEQQLGYIVYASPMPILDVPGIGFVIQSPVADPQDLEERVDAFLGKFGVQLDMLGEEALRSHKDGLISRILEAEERLEERADRYWTEIDREEVDFDSRERLVQAVLDVGLPDLLETYRELTGPHARRLVVRSAGRGHAQVLEGAPAAVVEGYGSTLVVDTVQAFKAGRERIHWLEPE